jgi:predicted solute-binding protein
MPVKSRSVSSRSAGEVVTPELVQDFQDSLAFGLRHLDTIATEAATELQLPASELRRYLTENIDYRLDKEHRDALALFYELATKLGRIDSVKMVVYATEVGGPLGYMDAVTKSPAGN